MLSRDILYNREAFICRDTCADTVIAIGKQYGEA